MGFFYCGPVEHCLFIEILDVLFVWWQGRVLYSKSSSWQVSLRQPAYAGEPGAWQVQRVSIDSPQAMGCSPLPTGSPVNIPSA